MWCWSSSLPNRPYFICKCTCYVCYLYLWINIYKDQIQIKLFVSIHILTVNKTEVGRREYWGWIFPYFSRTPFGPISLTTCFLKHTLHFPNQIRQIILLYLLMLKCSIIYVLRKCLIIVILHVSLNNEEMVELVHEVRDKMESCGPDDSYHQMGMKHMFVSTLKK